MDKKLRVSLKSLFFLLSLLGLALVLKATGVTEMFDTAWADKNLAGKGISGYLLYLGLASLLTAVGMPRQLVSFLGGYAFGVVTGTLLALLGTLFGSVLSFSYSRFLAQGFIMRRHQGKIKKVNDLFTHKPFTMALILRLMPMTNNLLTNLLAGVSTIPAHWFFLGSAIGYAPQTLIFALLGSGVRVDPAWRISISILLFVLATLLGWSLYRKYKMEKTLSELKQ